MFPKSFAKEKASSAITEPGSMEETSVIISKFTLWVLPLLFAITMHEVAHGLAAKKLGDNTAERLGRLSLNPLHHIDPVGTLLVPGLLLIFGGFIFGWAKPVPVDFRRLRNPMRDMALVAVAGPLANLAMALIWALIARIAFAFNLDFFILMGKAGISINLILMILNLLPLPPLDGGRIAVGLLPSNLSYKLSLIEPYGFVILLVLMSTGLLSGILGVPLQLFQAAIYGLAGF